MDHEVASKTQAVERYLLGEMPPEERDAFEDHYFSCMVCAEEVRTASSLTGDIRRVLRQGVPETGRSRFSWLRLPVLVPTCAAVLLAVLAGYQNTVVLPGLKAPREIGAAVILDGQTRSGLPKVRAGAPLRFQMALEPTTAAGRLAVELEGAEGHKIETGEIPAPPANQPLDVYFPGEFEPGRYAVVVREDPSGRELARNSFEIVDKDKVDRDKEETPPSR